MYFHGFEISSSSVKVSLIEGGNGRIVGSDFSPKTEMKIITVQPGWAKQDPNIWVTILKTALQSVIQKSGTDTKDIKAIGITWRMRVSIALGKNNQLLRSSIIWCDRRATPTEKKPLKKSAKKCACHIRSTLVAISPPPN